MNSDQSGSTIQESGRKIKCKALGLADSRPCEAEATAAHGLFCRFHAKQCFGLYKGYKRRNAQLDELVASPPQYLAESHNKLANEDFAAVTEISIIDEIHAHLFKRFALLDRVIRARKLHHAHFYAQDMDYGHEKFLNSLITHKLNVVKALENAVTRTAELLFDQSNWLKWAKERQQEEFEQRDSEQKKLKREAALFRRRAKELDKKLQEARAKDDARKQEEFLESAYQKNQVDLADQSDVEDWDPIDDVMEYERTTYVDIIRRFLWLDETPSDVASNAPGTVEVADPTDPVTNDTSTKKKKSKSKAKKSSDVSAEKSSSNGKSAQTDVKGLEKEPDIANIETMESIKTRLLTGMEIVDGTLFTFDIQTREKIRIPRMPPWPQAEVDRIVEEVKEVKQFLFCRQILALAPLLTIATKVDNLDDFFTSPEVKSLDLRDLCLKLEQPQLQDIRDACADFMRSKNPADMDEDANKQHEDSEDEVETRQYFTRSRHKHKLPKKWQSKWEKKQRKAKKEGSKEVEAMLKAMQDKEEDPAGRLDFRGIDEEGRYKKKKLRVRICGRYIHHYPSEGPLQRGGWLHFSIIARDCSLPKASALCKSWDEFWELSLLSIYLYFPSPGWLKWVGDLVKPQYVQLGFVPFFSFEGAEALTMHKSGRIGGQRIAAAFQARNYLCGHMKRNDPFSRRFIQLTSLNTSRMIILVRDGKTGKIVVKPPEDELWLVRQDFGHKRLSRMEMKTMQYVGPEFFADMESRRAFNPGFTDFYEIYIWASTPGTEAEMLLSSVHEMLCKARKVRHPMDIYLAAAPYIQNLVQEQGERISRIRDRRPGETTRTVYEEILQNTKFMFRSNKGSVTTEVPRQLRYSEADEMEDQILFPPNRPHRRGEGILRPFENMLTNMEMGTYDIMKAFVQDKDTDDEWEGEFSDEEDVWSVPPEDQVPDLAPDAAYHKEKNDNADDADGTDEDDIDEHEDLHQDVESEAEEWEIPPAIEQEVEKIEKSFGPAPQRFSDMHEQFIGYVELYKSKPFKLALHAADLEPGAQKQWASYILLRTMAECDPKLGHATYLPCFQLLKELNYHPTHHSRVVKDMNRAFSVVMLFFPQGRAFFGKPKPGDEVNKGRSTLFKQKERSLQLPDRRSSSNQGYRDKAFFAELEKALAQTDDDFADNAYNALPVEMDLVVRPAIATFFKHGLILPSYFPDHEVGNRAFMTTEPHRPDKPDFFIDYRDFDARRPSQLEDPKTITIASLLKDCKTFLSTNPQAKFSLLRIWSSPHFYPFMCAGTTREALAFVDSIGRSWEWRVMPKDMTFSEFSVHKNVTMRFDNYKSRTFGKNSSTTNRPLKLGDKIRIKKDVVLVAGVDEEDCLNVSAAATFLIQTEPWRLEVDFFKSFLNVDIEFLEGLDERWWL